MKPTPSPSESSVEDVRLNPVEKDVVVNLFCNLIPGESVTLEQCAEAFYGKTAFHKEHKRKPNWKNSVAARMRKLIAKQHMRCVLGLTTVFIYRCSPVGRASPAMYSVKEATNARKKKA